MTLTVLVAHTVDAERVIRVGPRVEGSDRYHVVYLDRDGDYISGTCSAEDAAVRVRAARAAR